MPTIDELYWRPDRIEHIARHSVTPAEVEEALLDDESGVLLRIGPAERYRNATVYRYFGRTEDGRHLLIVLIYLGQGLALPLTARDMTFRERRTFNARRPRRR
jgi:uncharacterized protein